ncbi:flagellar biosynthesis protein FlhF [Helicobacter pylori Hp P-28b]|uniref:flagellar biosynthesis protein FlhF n=1 Tax=Helicobacter pylori TaxID=210 RepID=UPI00026B36F6|nr:flagellar biosynthesis protein FlhF [Helicobacter pylori]EJC39344.1 flagellar biosynthesis protein FlhF [Helicobacter pylori Hp P-28b]
MKFYTYSGETAAEALKIAQSHHGVDTLVFKTQEIRKKTLTSSGLYEIVVAVEEEENKKAPLIPESLYDEELNEEDVVMQLSSTVEEMRKLAGVSSNQCNYTFSKNKTLLKKDAPLEDVPLEANKQDALLQALKDEANHKKEREKREVKQEEEIKDINAQLSKIRDSLKLIQNMFWDEKNPNSVNIPQEFAEIYKLAKQSGMKSSHLDEIMQLSLELMPLRMRENSVTIKRYFREVLRKMILCRPEDLNLRQKRILMLVGPTGVGKTTTLAKLAARYSRMLAKKYKVGIITLDNYRIGALEQLSWYANKMKMSIEAVIDAKDFAKEIEALEYCDFILVDTTGHSQYDKEKIAGLKEFIDGGYNIDVSLVLSVTTKYEDMKDIYDSFGVLGIDTLIFTKLDESRGLGNLFSLVHESQKPISYLSVGQEVPMDLKVATNEYLVDCMLDGFSNPNKEQA